MFTRQIRINFVQSLVINLYLSVFVGVAKMNQSPCNAPEQISDSEKISRPKNNGETSDTSHASTSFQKVCDDSQANIKSTNAGENQGNSKTSLNANKIKCPLNYVCTKCQLPFSSERDFCNHFRNVHKKRLYFVKNKKFYCSICHLLFGNDLAFLMHSVHNKRIRLGFVI